MRLCFFLLNQAERTWAGLVGGGSLDGVYDKYGCAMAPKKQKSRLLAAFLMH